MFCQPWLTATSQQVRVALQQVCVALQQVRASLQQVDAEACLEGCVLIQVRVPHDVVGVPDVIVHVECDACDVGCDWLKRRREDSGRL